jgi:hypothetical protein
VLKVQGVVTQPDNQDYFVVKAEVESGMDETAVPTQLQEMIRNLCRVRVDEVHLLKPGALGDGAGMVDGRAWNQ